MILSRQSYEALLEEIPKYMGNYLEIGVYDGDALREFATRWPHKKFFGIDPFLSCKDTTDHTGVTIGQRMESQQESAHQNFKGIANIMFFEGTSKLFLDTVPQSELDNMKISVVYVDGSHTYDDTMTDLILAGRCIRQGLIYIDDVGLPAVDMAILDFMDLNHSRIVPNGDIHKILLRA